MKRPQIVVLTGAGISAESGIKTFRDHNGLWENHSVEEVASLEGFKANPVLVHRFYNQRRAQLLDPEIMPNAAHLALAKLERSWKGEFLLVTQNVDDLHERAGSNQLIHMHGELFKARCLRTAKVYAWRDPLSTESLCECCGIAGTLRPHIVWFGEVPLQLDPIHEALKQCDLFIAIGTSGLVYPAAGFLTRVKAWARTIEVNKETSAVSDGFKERRTGLAGECVPDLVEQLLKEPGQGME